MSKSSPSDNTSRTGEPSPASSSADTYAIPVVPPPWLGWAVAICFLFAAFFFAAKSFNIRGQLQSVLETERITRLEVGTLKNLLEAERILSRGQLEQLSASVRRSDELHAQADLARLKIVALSSRADNAPQARAIIVWSSDRQEGVLVVSALPAPPSDKDYQLWLVDDLGVSISGGVVGIDSQTAETRVSFKPGQETSAPRTFFVSLERKGGAPKAEGPKILISG
jgi:hypothetical protein